MKLTTHSMPMLLLGLAACNQSPSQEVESDAVNDAQPAPAVPSAPASNIALPDDRTPLEEPKGPIDPKSAEAAGQVVQHYGALIEQKRSGEAAALWGDAASASTFAKGLPRSPHMEIGKPGEMEGAAGSSYVRVPVIFYSKGFRRAADVILRRVNDVPGSSVAQRRWHIERVEWKG